MLIDFHTHVFPEKIAAGALKVLSDNAHKVNNENLVPGFDGTINGLIDSMDKNGVDISVVLPIATKASQTPSINKFAQSIQSDRVFSFGSLYPDEDDYEDVLVSLKEKGFKGIKLHPEYQQFYIDSKYTLRILIKAEELGLYTTLHAGKDIGIEPPVHCAPDRLKNVLEYVSGKYIIAAHLGGYNLWDDVEKYLVGTDILLDTAFISDYITKEQCKRIIKNHSADKILFASDSPWENPHQEYEFIKSLDLSEQENEKIFYKNAQKILGI